MHQQLDTPAIILQAFEAINPGVIFNFLKPVRASLKGDIPLRHA